MIRSVEYDCETRRERNQRGASLGAAMALAARVKAQRAATRDALNRLGAHVPQQTLVVDNVVQPNQITVRLTRISPGELDDDGPDDALKNVRDEVAKWMGIDDRRNPVVMWPRGQQERGPANVYRVRIEIDDLAPGEPRRVILAEAASHGRATQTRVKRQITAEMKRQAGQLVKAAPGRVLAAPSPGPRPALASTARGSRAAAEAGFARLTGKPTANDLRDAAERALSKPRASSGCHERPEVVMALDQLGRGPDPVPSPRALEREAGAFTRPHRDPGDEAPARDLADCETCGARVGAACTRIGSERFAYGVHEARARAAGLHVPPDDRAAVRPARSGQRRIVPPAPAALPLWRSWAALPWEQRACDACDPQSTNCDACKGRGRRGLRLAHLARFDGREEPPPATTIAVPLEHRARYGAEVVLHRRKFTSTSTGPCWLFDTKGS